MKKRLFVSVLIQFLCFFIFSQEALKSLEENYYDFLSLQGLVERPYLSYRTLSDSKWTIEDEESELNLWKNFNLKTILNLYESSETTNFFLNGIDRAVNVRIYGPEWFNSYNTATPYGQNDGALWQGRGYNTSLSAGVRIEAFGLEATFKPQLSFSQNKEFEYYSSTSMQSPLFKDKGGDFGYIWGIVDAPQRFGDKAFWNFDLGDTEIRYNFYTLTLGFGTEAIWLGPSNVNSVLHSNNAPTYPKFDMGMRKTKIILPWNDLYIGDLEGRIWIGYLSESEYFDSNEENDHNQFTGFNCSVAPAFLPGLTLTANKVCLNRWGSNFWKYLNPFYSDNTLTADGEDQKMSISASWLLPQAGFEMYAEFGKDDYSNFIVYPQRSLTTTVGFKKVLNLSEKNLSFLINLEYNNTEMSQDFFFQWPYNFGFHHHIKQGYTNKGQWIGSGYGYGGNSLLLSITALYSKGKTEIFVQRGNPDCNYIYSKAIGVKPNWNNEPYFPMRAELNFGINSTYFLTSSYSVSGEFVYNDIINPYYKIEGGWIKNFHLSCLMKYNF